MKDVKIEQNVIDFLNTCSKEVGKYEDDMFNQNVFCFFGDHKVTSPIEQLFYCALQTIIKLNVIDDGDAVDIGDKTGIVGISCIPQKIIGKYRVDFKVTHGKYSYKKKDFIYKKVIVECDSQQFHERTEKERRYEKQRDRFLIKEGYHVFHFTGSEIFNNPLKVAKEVVAYLTKYTEEDLQSDSGIESEIKQ